MLRMSLNEEQKAKMRAYHKEYYQKNKEKIIARTGENARKKYYENLNESRKRVRDSVAKYREANPEKMKEAQDRWYAAHGKEYREANKDKHAVHVKNWEQNNKEKKYRKSKEWWLANEAKKLEYEARRDPEKQKIRQKAYRLENPEKSRNLLLAKYGLTVKQWDEKFELQGKACELCGDKNPKSKIPWHTDHCHVTGKTRGILCHHCNNGLGRFKDSRESLLKAIAYLDKYGG